MIQNDHELEVTRQRITAFQDALLALRRNQLPTNYAQMAQNFLVRASALYDHDPAPCGSPR